MTKSRDRFQPLSELVASCLQPDGAEAFGSAYPDALLILDDVEDEPGEVGFQTIRVDGDGGTVPSGGLPPGQTQRALAQILGHLSGSPNKWVYPLENRSGKFAAMFTVGRAANSDVRLNVASLSKFRAYFTNVARDQAWYVSDAGSSSGTFINGEELPPSHGKVRLASGTTIRFGPDITAQFYVAGLFWELLQSCTEGLAETSGHLERAAPESE